MFGMIVSLVLLLLLQQQAVVIILFTDHVKADTEAISYLSAGTLELLTNLSIKT